MNKKFRYIKIRDEKPAKKKPNKRKKEKIMRTVGNAMMVIGTTISSMMLILVIMMCIVVTVVTVYILDFKDSSQEINLKETDMNYTSILYAYNADGQEVELKRLVKEENRIWVDYENISPNLINAVVAKEDKRFWDHKGVDWRRTVVALVRDVFVNSDDGTRQGGSTITQQLIKNITKDNEQTWERKLREIFRALDLEEKYNKEQILESYLNRIGFGSMNYGIGAACEAYFGKSASDVDIAEAAIIVGIIKNPSKFYPYANLDLCKDQQLWVLREMYEQGYISTAEYEAAKVEQVQFKDVVYGDAFGYIDPRSIAEEKPEEQDPEENESEEAYKWNGNYEVSQNWYTDAAINQVIADYAELKGITKTSASNEIYNGGYKIYTNMDMAKQAILEAKYRDPTIIQTKYDKYAEKEDLLQGAMVIMDYTGTVEALVGGVGDKPGDNCFNRATMSVRSPGSTIKPIGPYSTAIQENAVYYSMMVPDKGIKVKEFNHLWPYNYNNVIGNGTLRPIWYAVQESLNTISVRTTRMLTPQVVYNQLTQNLGLSTLVDADIAFAPMSMGAVTEGIKLIELTAAYQIMGNGGVYYEPMLYSRVVDSRGNVILEQDFYGTQAIDSDTSWITNRMMRKVVLRYGNTAYQAQLNNIEVVGKTGTSNSGFDLLFAGLTPHHVAVGWVGNDFNKEVNKIPNKKAVAKTWHDVMTEIEDTTQVSNFTPDPSTIERKYCTETGLLASPECTSTEIGYYRASNIPSMCSGNHEYEIEKIKEHWDTIDASYDEPQSN